MILEKLTGHRCRLTFVQQVDLCVYFTVLNNDGTEHWVIRLCTVYCTDVLVRCNGLSNSKHFKYERSVRHLLFLSVLGEGEVIGMY